MASESLLCEVKDGHARLTLNRPEKHNPLDGELIGALSDTLAGLAEDPALRVVTLQGAGKSFCAGADLKFFLGILEDAPALNAYIRKFKTTMAQLEHFPVPVIAVVHGYVLAGGLELMLSCDLTLAAEDAMIGDQHINFGLLPGGGGSQRLPRLLGMRKAKELMFLGTRISGAEAAERGLVNKAVPAEGLEAALGEWVDNLREKSRNALRYMKEMVSAAETMTLAAGLDYEETVNLNYTRLDDLHEGLSAFKEKRKPNF